MILALESVDRVKPDCLPQCGRMSSNALKGQIEKNLNKVEFTLSDCLLAGTLIFSAFVLDLNLGHWFSQAPSSSTADLGTSQPP